MRYEIQLERMRSDAMQLGYLHGFKLRAKSTIQANFRSINSKPLILSAIYQSLNTKVDISLLLLLSLYIHIIALAFSLLLCGVVTLLPALLEEW